MACCACLCMCKCGCATLSYVKDGLCKAEYSFTVLICHGARVPYSLPMPKLSRYFECWLPHPQTVDTELLSLRLAEYLHCVPECMHGSGAS